MQNEKSSVTRNPMPLETIVLKTKAGNIIVAIPPSYCLRRKLGTISVVEKNSKRGEPENVIWKIQDSYARSIGYIGLYITNGKYHYDGSTYFYADNKPIHPIGDFTGNNNHFDILAAPKNIMTDIYLQAITVSR